MTSNPQESLYYKRRLPHLYINAHPVFLTWRLKFDLPKFIKQHFKVMKDDFDAQTKDLSEEYKKMQGYTYHKKVFGWFDTQLGEENTFPALLNNSEIIQIIDESLHFNDDKKYRLHAFCIMPNHVHALITPYSNQIDIAKTLSGITLTWKRYTAVKINQLIGNSGALWSSESYDHTVRNETEFSGIISYILLNPEKANLVKHWDEWRGSWVADEYKSIMG